MDQNEGQNSLKEKKNRNLKLKSFRVVILKEERKIERYWIICKELNIKR